MTKEDYNELDIHDEEWFFGDEVRQQNIVDRIGQSVRNQTGKVYIVTGGSRSGKSSILKAVKENLERDKAFILLDKPAYYLETPPLDSLKDDLRPDGLFESNSKNPHEVLFIAN